MAVLIGIRSLLSCSCPLDALMKKTISKSVKWLSADMLHDKGVGFGLRQSMSPCSRRGRTISNGTRPGEVERALAPASSIRMAFLYLGSTPVMRRGGDSRPDLGRRARNIRGATFVAGPFIARKADILQRENGGWHVSRSQIPIFRYRRFRRVGGRPSLSPVMIAKRSGLSATPLHRSFSFPAIIDLGGDPEALFDRIDVTPGCHCTGRLTLPIGCRLASASPPRRDIPETETSFSKRAATALISIPSAWGQELRTLCSRFHLLSPQETEEELSAESIVGLAVDLPEDIGLNEKQERAREKTSSK